MSGITCMQQLIELDSEIKSIKEEFAPSLASLRRDLKHQKQALQRDMEAGGITRLAATARDGTQLAARCAAPETGAAPSNPAVDREALQAAWVAMYHADGGPLRQATTAGPEETVAAYVEQAWQRQLAELVGTSRGEEQAPRMILSVGRQGDKADRPIQHGELAQDASGQTLEFMQEIWALMGRIKAINAEQKKQLGDRPKRLKDLRARAGAELESVDGGSKLVTVAASSIEPHAYFVRQKMPAKRKQRVRIDDVRSRLLEITRALVGGGTAAEGLPAVAIDDVATQMASLFDELEAPTSSGEPKVIIEPAPPKRART